IADSNHNQIVITKLDGTLQALIGKGTIGREDGAFESCSFNHPQGMVIVGNLLYIADTENHLIRKADLASRRVVTIAGTGKQGNPALEIVQPSPGSNSSQPLRTALSSPWALWAQAKVLYVAMAGMHQIWKISLDESTIAPFAGNGREDIVDG